MLTKHGKQTMTLYMYSHNNTPLQHTTSLLLDIMVVVVACKLIIYPNCTEIIPEQGGRTGLEPNNLHSHFHPNTCLQKHREHEISTQPDAVPPVQPVG